MFRNIYIVNVSNPNIDKYIDIDFCTNIFYMKLIISCFQKIYRLLSYRTCVNIKANFVFLFVRTIDLYVRQKENTFWFLSLSSISCFTIIKFKT